MKRFLIIKHWQVFILIFIVPLIIEEFGKEFIQIIPMLSQEIPALNESISIKSVSLIFTFMASGLLLWWIWTVGINLHLKLANKMKYKINRFKTASFISFTGFLFCKTIISFSLNSSHGFVGFIAWSILLIIVVWSYLYSLYYNVNKFH